MAKSVAQRWLEAHSHAEHRLTVYYGHADGNHRGLPRLLKAFRDGYIRLGKTESIPDLGIRTGFDSVEIWSSDREKVVAIRDWLTAKGHETTGVF